MAFIEQRSPGTAFSVKGATLLQKTAFGVSTVALSMSTENRCPFGLALFTTLFPRLLIFTYSLGTFCLPGPRSAFSLIPLCSNF
jgi:hypothetical protein